MQNLTRIGGIYYVRVAVPADLRPHFSRREIKISLKTSQKSLAKKLARPLLSSIHQQFFQMRYVDPMHQRPPSKEALQIFAQLHPGISPNPTFDYNFRNRLTAIWPHQLMTIQDALDQGYSLNEDGEWLLTGQPAAVPMQAPPPAAPMPIQPQVVAAPEGPPPTAPKRELMVADAIALYLDHCENPAKKNYYKARAVATMYVERAATKHLVEWLGTTTITISEVVKKDFKEFGDYFIDTIGNKKTSVRTWMNALKRFFKLLHEFQYIDEPPVIIFPKIYGLDKIKKANLSYSRDMLQQLFDYLADNVPKDRRARITRVELSYLLLVMLYTGFRRSETRFTVDDVRIFDNIPVFMQENLTKDNVKSIRFIPLHRDLVFCGILDFVKRSKNELFPKNESVYSAKFRSIRNALGYGELRKYPFHAFRTTFDSHIQGLVEDSTRRLFMGHSTPGEDKTYLEQLKDKADQYRTDINKLQYDIDFRKLKRYLTEEMKMLY